MPIQEQNIVFVESQILDDVPEGGGAATGKEVIDGAMNNVFEDISDLDRAMGRFNLRKLFLAVRALNTDLYGGSKLVVTELPEDDALGYTVFTTGDAFDTRGDAVNRVEAYLFKGPMWPGALQSNHIQGMQAINVIQRVGTQIPPIGKTLCIVQDEGLGGEKEQYVRVIDVTVTNTTFEDAQGTFDRWVVRMDLSDPLLFDFTGHDANRFDSYSYTGKARLRDTTVADAQRYFGAQTLAEPAAIGDTSVRAQSQFAQLVPSARTETALVAQPMNPTAIQTVSGGARTVDVPQQAHTLSRAVTPENRRLNWIETVRPKPAPGTLAISYMAQGAWYTITDDGAGVISGTDPTFGSGTVDYVTGNINVTLGALPDAGTQVIWVWASPVHYTVRTGSVTGTITVQLPHEAIVRNSVSLDYYAGGVLKTATDDGAGVINETATPIGSISYTTGLIELTIPVDTSTTVEVTYSVGDPLSQTFTDPPRNPGDGTVTLGLTTLPIAERSVRLTWNTDVEVYDPETREVPARIDPIMIATDDGAGVLKFSNGVTVGTINYATGVITFQPDATVTIPVLNYDWINIGGGLEQRQFTGFSYVPAGAVAPVDFDATVTYRSTDDPQANTYSATPSIKVHLTPGYLDAVIPGSVRFSIAGKTYEDRDGDLHADIVGGVGIVSGSIDYDKATATLTNWGVAANLSCSVTSCLTVFGQWTSNYASFRTASAPIAPEGLSIVATSLDGVQINGTADANGDVTGDFIRGTVNYNFGIGEVEFGSMVGPDWGPIEVDPGTIRYNAVAYRYIPLPANILGVNAVRLPPDGRVPIFKSGDVVMVMHRLETAPVSPTNGVPVSLGRTRIAWVRVIDSTGATVTDGYTLDRENGTVTFADVSGLSLPLTIRHTVGDLRLVTDAQINGDLTLARELTHDYPAGESLVASCLLFGDRRARVSHLWDQVSWNGTWVDSIVGSPATATLNTIDFPITVTNEGADTDRWIFRVTSAAANQWELISEKRGLVWSGTYAPGGADVAPINPRTRTWDEMSQTWVGGTPYMTIPGLANGGGWANGNVVRINTVGAIADFWIARSIAQSDEPAGAGLDGAEIYALGNIDRP
jgi:hypothetical protein